MRNLLFKNLTSADKRRKIIVTTESMDNQGVRSIIRRHFVYLVKEIKERPVQKAAPCIFIRKERNSKEQKEKFYCKIKGDMYTISNERLFLVSFIHSLRICLIAIPKDLMECSE